MIKHQILRSLGTLFIPVLLLVSCKENGEKTLPVQQHITESVYASGLIKAFGQYEVFAPSNGILIETFVKAGDTLSPGTPLFKIDNTISSLSSENARLAMEILKEKSGPGSGTLLDMESKMKLAAEKKNNDSLLFVRQKNLWDQGVGSKIELEKRELAYKASKTEYESARLMYQQVKSELETSYQQAINSYRITEKQQTDFTVKSAIKGTVYSILRDPGEFVSTQTAIAVVGETNRFEIELQVDEFDIVKILPGQRTFLTMDSYRGKVFEARITRVEPYMNQRTRTFTIWAEFTESPEKLYPNLSVEANVLVAEKQNALTIPANFLIGKDQVLTAPDETTQVVTGITNLQWVEITNGLQPNREIYLPSR